jgi:putative membrane protein
VLLAATGPITWTSWNIDPPALAAVAVGILYWTGNLRTFAPKRTAVERRWRTAAFYVALLCVIIALDSPIDGLSERLFWVHMIQHILLLAVAPPLIILARPWIRLWRPFPLAVRQSLGRTFSQRGSGAPVLRVARFLGTPTPSLVLFSVLLLGWHVPALFDATLRSSAIHITEHLCFFAAGMLFWKQVIDSPPLRARLAAPQRVAYIVGALIIGWVLALILALAPHPLYPYYAHLASRPGGISAFSDQQIAAGIMLVPGSLSFVIALLAYVYRWVTPPTPARVNGATATLAGDRH